MLCTWANGGDTSNSSPAPLAHKTLTTYLGIVTNNGDWRDGEETPLSVSPKETIMQYIAIFNPEASRWDQQAYAIVNDEDEEKEICIRNGFSSSQRRELSEFTTPAGKFFLESLVQVK